MSQCATLADDTLDQQKEIGPEITVRDVVEFILEEAVFAAVFFSDKDCSRIGDFSIGTDFRQSFDQVPAYSKEFGVTKLNPRQNGSEGRGGVGVGGGGGGGNAKFKLESGESIDRSISLLTARENLELILDSLMKKEEKVKNLNDCKIISENLLADSELRIENGQIRFGDEKKKDEKDDENRETSHRETQQESDGGKIQMEFLTRGNMPPDDFSSGSIVKSRAEDDGEEKETKIFHSDLEMRPTEDFRQVFSEPNIDPNRPRAYAIAEEDVRKMAEEMEKINGSVRRTIPEKESEAKEEVPSSGTTSAFAFDNDSDLNGNPSVNSSDLVEKTAPFSKCDHVLENEFSTPGDLKEHLLFRDRESFVDTSNSNSVISETNHYVGDERDAKVKNYEFKITFNSKTEITLSSVDNENFVRDEFCQIDSSGESFLSKCVEEISAAASASLEAGFMGEAKPQNENPDEILKMAEKNANFPVVNDVDSADLPAQVEETGKVEQNLPEKNKAPIETRETEMAFSDSRLGTEKRIHNLKPCQSAFGVTETSSPKFGPDYFSRMKSENSKDGFFSVENKMETSSGTFKHSNSFMEEVPERILYDSVDIEHPQSNLSAGKSETNFFHLTKEENENFKNSLFKIKHKESSDLEFFPIASTTLPEEKSFQEEEKIQALEEDDNCKSLKDENESKIITRENNEDGDEKLIRGPSHSHFSDFILHPEVVESPENNIEEKKILTEVSNSQENFISQVENVIQIIDPADGQSDDEGESVSFSFPEEFEGKESREIEGSENKTDFSSVVCNDPGKRVRSGMTTIGPMKSVDHDPKDLTSNVDFGKMTHIKSSGKEAMEDDLSVSDIPSSTSLKMAEESEESRSAAVGGEPIRVGSFVNRDIASLTKVQKIREVMSYHPKPEDDFEDDSNLNRLDLKDVESMTDERYKLQDVSVPLLSFDVRDTDSRGSKDLIQNLNLVLSGNCFANGNFYLTDDAGAAAETSTGGTEEMSFSGGATGAGSVENEADGPTRKVTQMGAEDVVVIEANEDESKSEVGLRSPENDSSRHRLKHHTLGSVFRKASNKLIRKEDDGFYLRNTKSLPRDASKMMAAESIKSILEDCHSSAANVLKKSQSFLKSTQTLFKTFSQSGFGGSSSTNELNERTFPPGPDGSPANSEGKLQTFLRKEDLAKAKNAIIKKIEKTFKTADYSVKNKPESPVSDSNLEEVNPPKKNESARLKESKDNDEGDRENVKSKNFSFPKSPLVYKSQFVKSKIKISSEFSENSDLNSISFFATNGKTLNGRPVSDRIITKERDDSESNGKCEKRTKAHRETLVSGSEDKEEREKCNQVPDYIVMETVEGLPASDLETSCYLVEVEISESPDAVSIDNDQYFGTLKSPGLEDGKSVKKDDVSGEVNVGFRSSIDGSPAAENSFPSVDVDKCKLTENVDESGKKCRNKSKKLTSRFKNFWSSAFGKAKRTPIKGTSLEHTHE